MRATAAARAPPAWRTFRVMMSLPAPGAVLPDGTPLAAAAIAAWNAQLKSALRRHYVSAEQFADELDVAASTLRRRIAGTSAWPLDDFLYATRRFGLQVDAAPDDPRELLTFRALPREEGVFDAEAYLTRLSALSELVDPATHRLDVITGEIPVFYLFAHPLLTAVKLFLFEHTQGGGVRERFDGPTQIQRYGQLLPMAAAVARRYRALPRREIWSGAPLRDLLSQLDLLAAEELLVPSVAPAIREALSGIVDGLANELCGRWEASPLALRYQGLHTTAPAYQVCAGTTPLHSFVTFDNPDFLEADGQAVHEAVARRFARAHIGAIELDGAAGKCVAYFERARGAIARAMQ